MSEEKKEQQHKYRIMVIDDSITIRRAAQLFLTEEGHEVILAQDGLEALSKMGIHPPDLIFCDILMPKLDGYETCALIKKNTTFRQVPFVMLSSQSSIFDKAKGFLVGSNEHISKPFDKQMLLDVVKKFCETSKQDVHA
jgi:twitching motility two-component system response regulator PilG